MKKINIVMLSVLVSNMLFADNTLKMKNVDSIINNKQAVLIDKKNLHNFIVNSSKENNVGTISNVNLAVENVVLEKQIIKEESINNQNGNYFLIQNKTDFINNINESNKQYKLNLLEALSITKYLYDNNLQKKYYPIIKALIIKDSKNYKQIDEITFNYDIEYMTASVAEKMINEIFNNK